MMNTSAGFPVMTSPPLKIPLHFDVSSDSEALNPTYTSSYYGVHRGTIGVLAVKHPFHQSSSSNTNTTRRAQQHGNGNGAGHDLLSDDGAAAPANGGGGRRPLTTGKAVGVGARRDVQDDATKSLTPFSREMWNVLSEKEDGRRIRGGGTAQARQRQQQQQQQHPAGVHLDPEYRNAKALALLQRNNNNVAIEGWDDDDDRHNKNSLLASTRTNKSSGNKNATTTRPISPLNMEDPDLFFAAGGSSSPTGAADALLAAAASADGGASVVSGVSSAAVSFTAADMRPITALMKKKKKKLLPATQTTAAAAAADHVLQTRSAPPPMTTQQGKTTAPSSSSQHHHQQHIFDDDQSGRASISTLGQPTPDLYDVWLPNNALPAGRGLESSRSASKLMTTNGSSNSNSSIGGGGGGGVAPRPYSAGGVPQSQASMPRLQTSAPIPFVVHSSPMGWKLTTPARKRFVEAAALLAGLGDNERLPMPERLSELPESLGLSSGMQERARRGLAGPAPRLPLTSKIRQAVRRRHAEALSQALDRVRLGTGGGTMKWMGTESHLGQLKKIDTRIKMNVGAGNRPKILCDGNGGLGASAAIGRRFRRMPDEEDEELGRAIEVLRLAEQEQQQKKDRDKYVVSSQPQTNNNGDAPSSGPQSWGEQGVQFFSADDEPPFETFDEGGRMMYNEQGGDNVSLLDDFETQ